MICVHFRSARWIPITSISWAPMLCATPGGPHPDFITAIIIVDVSSLACQDTLPLLTPSAHLHMWCFAGGRWAARVCIVAALLWHRGGGVQYSPKGASHDSSLLHTLVPPSPTHKLNPPIYHIFFLLDPQTQISYRRPATRHSAGMTFLGSFQQYGGFRPWWRGLV